MNQSTSVIIRLQKLPWEATSADVRDFFRGLGIPDGGVHIVGGRDGEAFIAFITDEDARQAMRLDGKRIKNAKVKLYLSSRVEMQQVIDKARLELQQGVNQAVTPADGKEKNASRRRRSRSRSRSAERHSRRRSRSRSPRNWSKSGPGEGLKTEAPYQTPVVPAASDPAVPPFRNERPEMGSRYNQGRSVLDRTAPAGSMTGNFLDRAPPARGSYAPTAATGAPPRHHDFPFPQHRETGPPAFSEHAKVPDRGDARLTANAAEKTSVSAKVAQPGIMPPATFNPLGRHIEPAPFDGMAGRRFDGGLEMQADPNVVFNVHQPPPPVAPGRVARRALLPAPEDAAAPPLDDAGGKIQMRNFEVPPPPFAAQNAIGMRPPPPAFSHPPPLQQFPDAPPDWMRENKQAPSLPFNPAPHGRPTLLISPAIKKSSGLCVLVTAVPASMQRYGAIREFFHPLNLEGPDKIKIAVDDRGQRTGQVYCKFMTLEDAEVALTYTGKDKTYTRACTDAEFDAAVDGGLTRPRSRSKEREGEGGPARSHTREDTKSWSSSGSQRPDGSGGRDHDFVIEIKNIPYKANQLELIRYLERFNPLEIRRLYKHHATTGRVCTSDTAYAIFSNEKDTLVALKQHDRMVLDREVRISRISMSAMDEAFKRAPPVPPEAMAEWVVARDRHDRREYKDRYHIDRRLRHGDRPRSRSRTRSPPPRRRPPSPQLPYERPRSPYRRPQAPKTESRKEPAANIDSTVAPSFAFTCVCMKGMPMNATNSDVASFFNGLHIAANGIRIFKSTPGVAYVEFASPGDCEVALKKDRSYIGTQMVSVWPCKREEMMDAVHKQLGLNGGGGTGTSTAAAPIAEHSQQVQAFPELNMSTVTAAPSQPLLGSAMNATLSDPETSQLYMQQLGALMKQAECNKADGNQTKSQMDCIASTGEHNGAATDMVPIDPEVLCSIGVPGCVAALHNLPTQITLEEICQLFQGYQLIDDSVRMHYSNTGEPTGDCLLAFATAVDAQAAAADLNGMTIGGQTIRMYVVPT